MCAIVICALIIWGGGFAVAPRLRIAINHYQTVARHFRPGFLSAVQGNALRMWRGEGEASGVAIELRFPYEFNHDGDLSLIMHADGERLYQLTFSIAPGDVAGVPDRQVLLVAGIQGCSGKIGQIRRVTEACNNVAPVRMLLMAAESFAAALGIGAIVGVGQGHMTRPKPGVDEGFSFDYDAFWMATLDAADSRDFYHMPLPLPAKPIESVPAKHRARARQRRAQREIVRLDIARQSHVGLAPSLLP